jgi:hypothetical protein
MRAGGPGFPAPCPPVPDRRDDEPRAAMVQHIGHLFGHGVLIQRHRNPRRTSAPRPSTSKARAVAPDDGDVIAPVDAQRHQAQRDVADFLGASPRSSSARCRIPFRDRPGLSPCTARVARQQRRNGAQVARRRRWPRFLLPSPDSLRARDHLRGGAPLGTVRRVPRSGRMIAGLFAILTNCNSEADRFAQRRRRVQVCRWR